MMTADGPHPADPHPRLVATPLASPSPASGRGGLALKPSRGRRVTLALLRHHGAVPGNVLTENPFSQNGRGGGEERSDEPGVRAGTGNCQPSKL